MTKQSNIKLIVSSLLVLALLAACGPGLDPSGSIPTPEPESRGSSSSDVCLQGTWLMSNVDLNATMIALAPVPGLSIPAGTLVMAFTGDDFAYASDGLTIRIDMPGGYLEAESSFLFSGTFSTSDGLVNFSDVVYDVEAMTWRANINGEIEEAPGPSALLFPEPGSGPYGCSVDALTIETAGGAEGTVILYFTRQS